MAPKRLGYVAAKSVPYELLLQAVVDCAAGRGSRPEQALEAWPSKVVKAKLHKAARRGWIVDDVTITPAGLAVLEESPEGRPC